MLPTKLLEYVTMGIPCIVPKTGTISRYFDETCAVFRGRDVDSLAEAIVHTLSRLRKKNNAIRKCDPTIWDDLLLGVNTKSYHQSIERLLR